MPVAVTGGGVQKTLEAGIAVSGGACDEPFGAGGNAGGLVE